MRGEVTGDADLLERAAGGGVHDDRRVDAAVHRREMGDEVDRHLGDSRRERHLLFDFRQMTMSDGSIRTDALIAFRIDVGKIHLPSGSRDAAHGGDDDVLRLHQSGFEQGGDREDDAGRIASRAGDERGIADLFAVAFRRSVDRLFQQLRRGMILAVVFLVLGGGAEAEVRADVEHPDTGFHQGNRVFGGQSVREGEKSGIAFRGDLFDVRCGEFQVHSVKTGEDVGDLPARVLAGGDDPQIHIRMPRQARSAPVDGPRSMKLGKAEVT